MKNLKEKIIEFLTAGPEVKTLQSKSDESQWKFYNYENEMSKTELFHLKSSVEILNRILNNEKPYPNLDIDDVF